MSTALRSRLLTLVGIAAVATLGACSGKSNSPAAVRHNLTPNLDGQTMRYADSSNMFWHTTNGNLRQISDDFYRGGLYDRPARLSPLPSRH